MPRLQGPSVIAKPVMREKGKLNADDINDSVKEEEDKWKISQEEIEKKVCRWRLFGWSDLLIPLLQI
jgi:hypothetical protein